MMAVRAFFWRIEATDDLGETTRLRRNTGDVNDLHAAIDQALADLVEGEAVGIDVEPLDHEGKEA